MRELWARWQQKLLAPVDAASTAVFRCAFGALVAWDAVRFMYEGWIDRYFITPSLHFTYLYFDFVKPWPGQWMYVHFAVMGVLALLVSIGLFYRAATVLLFLAYSYFFLLEQSIYMNHYYLIAVLAFLLIWIPAHRAFSVDAWRRDLGPPVVPYWAVLILRFQLVVMYAYGGFAKLNPDWLRGEPMYSTLLRGDPLVPEIAYRLPPAFLAYGIAYGGIVSDFAIPILLVFRRTVAVGFAIACVFHLLNAIFLNIGIFSYLAVAAITIFFAPDWPRRWVRRTFAPVRATRCDGLGTAGTAVGTSNPHGVSSLATRIFLVMLHVYIVAQLVVPFRHLLYPGGVSWTEEGHRFAWQMKLRKKHSMLAIHATDPATGRRWTIDPRDDLSPRQLRKLGTFPDIMLQYVHHHRDRLRAEGIADPIITVDWRCSLNGRPYQQLVDPTVNLAAVDRSWRPATWIIPLNETDGAGAADAIIAAEAQAAAESLIKVTDE